jgi:hypothetical protein
VPHRKAASGLVSVVTTNSFSLAGVDETKYLEQPLSADGAPVVLRETL